MIRSMFAPAYATLLLLLIHSESQAVSGNATFDVPIGTDVGGIRGEDASTINVYGSAVTVHLFNSAKANVFGEILADVYAYDQSVVNVIGGHFSDPGTSNLTLLDSSTANIRSGRFDGQIVAFDDSVVNVWGGAYPRGSRLDITDRAVLNVYGTDLVLEPTAETGGTRFFALSGTLANGDVLNRASASTTLRGRIVVHNVPEPASNGLCIVTFLVLSFLTKRSHHASIALRATGSSPPSQCG